MAKVSDRVRRLRKERGLTQEEVARRAGLTLNSYGDIERGHVRDPHLSSLEAIAQALGVSIEALVAEEAAVPLAEAPTETGLAGTDPAGGFIIDGKVLEETADSWNLPPGQASALLAYLLRTGMISRIDLQEAREEGVRRQLAAHE